MCVHTCTACQWSGRNLYWNKNNTTHVGLFGERVLLTNPCILKHYATEPTRKREEAEPSTSTCLVSSESLSPGQNCQNRPSKSPPIPTCPG